MNRFIALVCFLVIITVSHAEDYSFAAPAVESKKSLLELSGNLDMKYSVLRSNKSSSLYKLQYYNQSLSDVLSAYRAGLYLDGNYRAQDFDVHMKTY